MKKSQAVEQFKQSHVNVIEKCRENNDIDEIITFWHGYVDKLLLDGLITRAQYAAWINPNFEPNSYVKDLIKNGTAAIQQAKKENQKSVSLMKMTRCLLKNNENVPVQWKICTFSQLSNGVQAAFKYFLSKGYDLEIVYAHKTADTKEWFNLVAKW